MAPEESRVRSFRVALLDAKIAVDKWHLMALANTVVTEVRQRVSRERYGRRGTTKERVWVNRHLLLTGYEHLSLKQRARLMATLAGEDPTNEICAAWGVKERRRHEVSWNVFVDKANSPGRTGGHRRRRGCRDHYKHDRRTQPANDVLFPATNDSARFSGSSQLRV